MAILTSPSPLSAPFSPLAGWGGILVTLVLLALVALAFLAFVAARSTEHERSEWQAWLDARSSGRRHGTTGPVDAAAPSPAGEPGP